MHAAKPGGRQRWEILLKKDISVNGLTIYIYTYTPSTNRSTLGDYQDYRQTPRSAEIPIPRDAAFKLLPFLFLSKIDEFLTLRELISTMFYKQLCFLFGFLFSVPFLSTNFSISFSLLKLVP